MPFYTNPWLYYLQNEWPIFIRKYRHEGKPKVKMCNAELAQSHISKIVISY